jgi:hypothetical protein
MPPTAAKRRPTAQVAITARPSSGDLAAAAYSDDDYNSTRGKTTMKPRRLGVFDQGTVAGAVW